METWFKSGLLGLCLAVFLLAPPGTIEARTPAEENPDPATEGFYHPEEQSESSTSSSSESLSPSQRSLLLSHTPTHSGDKGTVCEACTDTEQTQTFTETGSRSVQTISLSTEPLISPLSTTTETSSSSTGRNWEDFTNTEQIPGLAVSWEERSWMLTEDANLLQDSPDTTTRLRDDTALSSQTSVLTDNTYTTTISRAGERTLLSVTSPSENSTSPAFTEESDSYPPSGSNPPSPPQTEYTQSATSTGSDGREITDSHTTNSLGTSSETGSPAWPQETQSLTGETNITQHQHTEETSDSTPTLRLTESSTKLTEGLVSSTPPFTSPAESSDKISQTNQDSASSVGVSTASSTESLSSSTQNLESPEEMLTPTEEDYLGLTAAPSTVRSSTSESRDAVTDTSVLVTDALLTTTPEAVTEKSQITEEDTFTPTVLTTTTTSISTLPPPVTSSSTLSSTLSSSTLRSETEASVRYTAPFTTASMLDPQTSATRPTQSVSPSQTQGPSTGMAVPTKATTLQTETSTQAESLTTTPSLYVTTTVAHSTTSEGTEEQIISKKQADRGMTELVATTAPPDVQSTELQPPPLPTNPCVPNPCMNGGMCVSYTQHQFTCHCQQAWTGLTCSQDLDECEQDPCPVGSRCVNTQGSFSCECPLGFDLEDGRTCSRAKTFLGTFSVNRLPHDPVNFKSATMHEIQREIIQLLNMSLSVLRGYSRSTLSKKEESGVRIMAVNMFTVSSDVTTAEVYNSIQMSLSNCSSSLTHCRIVLHHQLTYQVESLCVAQRTQCDTERSTCSDISGTAQCQCLPGYYKHNPDDLSCLDCGDGFKLENGTCVPCIFGFGGFNCGNFYKLIAVVVSPACGALLIIFIIALIVTCCKKDKNDINKIIFKSGDLQMSPYADFPKNNRISMEWGRETIEMQENGSTKNLLQMTDIYYSPALRNADLERNGLYPFTGLPGSRHSCIYPAQWNPSFISDDSRRRDYF